MANQFGKHDSPRHKRGSLSEGTPNNSNPAYQLAHRDLSFLERDELRSLRFQLELLKPEMLLDDAKIDSTFVIYGSARSPVADPREAIENADRTTRKLAVRERHSPPADQPHEGVPSLALAS